jgi:CspA family cold shock protein
MVKVMLGVVSFYNRKRGWGFAIPDDNSSDLFLHASNLPENHRYLTEGDRISFQVGERNGRPLAVNIQIIKEAAVSSEARP